MPDKIAVSSYKRLVAEIASIYEGAKKTLIEARWKMGQRIVLAEQKGDIRAAYGKKLLFNLSKDLNEKYGPGFSERNLERIRAFYLQNQISTPVSKLSLAHHFALLPIQDKKKRQQLEAIALREGLKRDALSALVRHELVREQVAENLKKRDPGTGTRLPDSETRGTSPEEQVPLLTPPKDLTLRTYRKAALGQTGEKAVRGVTVLDCGFYVYRAVTSVELKAVTVTDKPAYAYPAVVERVVDGDTLALVIAVGFNTHVREKIRLRGIDCPELGSEEGEAAKRFVAKLLPPGASVVIRSSKSDKYGRFVADVFVKDKKGKENFLNNLLLQEGFAVRAES